jgi:hypothetical protein
VSRLAARRLWFSHLRGEALPGPSLSQSQWSFLAEEALHHQLAALTYRRLMDGPLADSVPAAVATRLRARYLDTAFKNAVLLRRTAELAAELAKEGIPVILLKGLHLARFVYAEPALRSMTDIDLLVPRERLAEAERIFLSLGYGPLPRPDLEEYTARSNHLAKLHKPGAPVLELHWTIELPTSPFHIDLDGLWARARATELQGVTVFLLAPEDLLLHLALHESYHHGFAWSALKGLVDLDAVVVRHAAELDWTVLAKRANTWGASGFIYTTLRLVKEILGTPIPTATFEALRHDPGDEAVIEAARQHVLSPELKLPEPYLELAGKTGLRERWSLIRRRVFLPRESMQQIYGLGSSRASVYPSYLRRVADLLARRGHLLLHSLLRTRTVRSGLEREANRRRIERWIQHRSQGG